MDRWIKYHTVNTYMFPWQHANQQAAGTVKLNLSSLHETQSWFCAHSKVRNKWWRQWRRGPVTCRHHGIGLKVWSEGGSSARRGGGSPSFMCPMNRLKMFHSNTTCRNVSIMQRKWVIAPGNRKLFTKTRAVILWLNICIERRKTRVQIPKRKLVPVKRELNISNDVLWSSAQMKTFLI